MIIMSKTMKASDVRMRADRAKGLSNARSRYYTAIRNVIALRRYRCCDDCPGWVVSVVDRDPGVEIERCDECCRGLDVTDDDCAALPEAREALAKQCAAMDAAYDEECGGD